MFLILESAKLKEEGKYNRAVKKLEKAISLEPDDATAYFHLGECYGRMNEPSKAAELYLKAMDRYTKTGEGYGCGYQLWASAAVSAIMWMNIPGGESCPRPTWFHDEGLKEISAELLTVSSSHARVPTQIAALRRPAHACYARRAPAPPGACGAPALDAS